MFRGSFVALVTPMLADGSVDYPAIASLVDHHLNNGSHGLVVIGTTGESVTLSFAEHLQVIETVCKLVDKRIYVLAGNGTNCTSQSIERTKALSQLPIDGFLTVAPYYNNPTQAGMVAHFKAIAAATDKPVLLYNVPGRTVTDLQPETVALLAEVDNIIGIKEATGQIDRVRAIKQRCGQDFICLSGDDATALAFLQAGGDGVVSVTANVAAAKMAQLCQAVFDKEVEKAALIDETLALLHQRLFLDPNPVPAKWVLHQMGLISTANVRSPLICLEPNHHRAIKEAMKVAKLI